MEDLGRCAQNIAEHWAIILSVIVLIVGLLIFCIQRTLMSMCYVLFTAGSTYVGAYLIGPQLVWFFVLGTFGIGAVACEGYW